MSVEQLVRLARQGQSAAMGELISRHERVGLAVAYGVLGDAEAAGEVVQESFVRAWQKLGDLEDAARFGGWLCGIVRNSAVDYRRRVKRRKSVDLAAAEGEVPEDRWVRSPADEAGRREDRERIAAAIGELDELSRMAVTLRYYQQLGSREIAEMLGLTPAAVDMRLSRARQELKRKLSESPAEAKVE